MNDLRGLVVGVEAVLLLVLSAANIVAGQLLGAAILVALAGLAAACAWAIWPADTQISGRADGRPRKAESIRRRPH